MVTSTIRQIEGTQFPAHSGIRFPQNGCLSCSHLGLCLGKQDMVDVQLIRRRKFRVFNPMRYHPNSIPCS